jgi:hypothetical protein
MVMQHRIFALSASLFYIAFLHRFSVSRAC